jgi:hypothetical protein
MRRPKTKRSAKEEERAVSQIRDRLMRNGGHGISHEEALRRPGVK